MSRLPRRCLEPGCGYLVRNGSRCPQHQRAKDQAKDQARGNTTERGYGSDWAKLSREAIRRHPWCTDCGHRGSNANPLTGDHLRWPAVSAIEDVEVVCRSCNSKRGALRGRRVSDSVSPMTPVPARETVTHPPGVPGLA